MEHEQELAEYRACLLKALTVSTHRSACSVSDPIHVFVNERRVGLLDGAGAEASLQLQSHVRIDTIELRSEDGVLLGGLFASEYGFKISRIPLRRDTIEIRVQNYAQGGSVSALFIPAPSPWRRARLALVGMADGRTPPAVNFARSGMWAIAFTQVLLAVALVVLIADRFTGGVMPSRTPPPITQTTAQTEVPPGASLAEVARFDQQLVRLSGIQTKALETIQLQQQGMAQLQRAMAKLSSTQETLASSMLSVKEELEQRQKGVGRDADRIKRVIVGQTKNVREQLEAEIHSLTVGNDRLSNELFQLHQNNRQLIEQMKSAGVDVSKATPPTSREAEDGE
ncbi:MAG: hypothetical protein HZB34_00240 [Nitrospirae bacterium]|nr:hypothetical protein [Nitrospirota bacterium]